MNNVLVLPHLTLVMSLMLIGCANPDANTNVNANNSEAIEIIPTSNIQDKTIESDNKVTVQDTYATLVPKLLSADSFGAAGIPDDTTTKNTNDKSLQHAELNLKVSNFVPNTSKSSDKESSYVDCSNKNSGYFCTNDYLESVLVSYNSLFVNNSEFIILSSFSRNEDNSNYSFKLNYIKDDIVYPTNWEIRSELDKDLVSNRYGFHPRFARVGSDYCYYGVTSYLNTTSASHYHCFKVNPDFDPNNNNSEPLILSEATFDKLVDLNIVNSIVDNDNDMDAEPISNYSDFNSTVFITSNIEDEEIEI